VLSSREMSDATDTESIPEREAVMTSMMRDIYNLDF
jgi:hypothetical protein